MADADPPEAYEPTETSVALEATAAVAAAMTAMAVPEPARSVVAAGLTPIYAKAPQKLIELAESWRSIRQGNANRVVGEAADELQIDIEELFDRIGQDARLIALVAEAVEAASATVLDQKVSGLAQVVASSMRPDAKIDESAMFVAALKDLERPHIMLLSELALFQWASRPERYRVSDDTYTHLRYRDFRNIAHRLPEFGITLYPAMMTLSRHGLVEQEQIDMSAAFGDYDVEVQRAAQLRRRPSMGLPRELGWKITKFGIALLVHLGHEGDDFSPVMWPTQAEHPSPS